MAWRFPVIDRIWRSRGSVLVEGDVTSDEALDRLSSLFDPGEMTVDRADGRIDYRKPNPAAQDKLATFSNGSLQLAGTEGRKELHFDVGSPALLLVFLAPLLFLALGLGTVALGQWEETKAQQQGEAEEEEEEDPPELHWFDQMLGAPAPEKPDDKDKDEEEENEDYDPNGAYGLAAIFALLYLIGRFLEPHLLKKTLRKVITGSPVNQS